MKLLPHRPSPDICRILCLVLWSTILFAAIPGVTTAQSAALSKADIDRLHKELSNWDRWGKDDQLGTLNLITPEKRVQAASLVQQGKSVSLARLVEKQTAADNGSPFQHKMLSTGKGPGSQWVTDQFTVNYHGIAHTHMDSLCHLIHDGKLYNGFTQSDITESGAGKLGIQTVRTGIFTRAILMDIPRLRGVKYLDPGTPIYVADLEAWENRAGVRVGSGDVVFIRTGKWARRDEKGAWDSAKDGLAGLHASCVKWLRNRDIAMLGSDAASDVVPSGVPGVDQPVHLLILNAMGTPIFDNCELEEVARVAAELKRWEFLITAAPLAVEGGTGSPLNPIAVF
ncbi:MAG: cyclase family protein [Planctomycetes bacterium]|nr:cyclase family protein [Planctomycetota bacterium]